MPALPSLRTWVAGEVVTAAEMNSNVRDGGNFFLAPPIAELRQAIQQSFANGNPAALLFDTEDVDSANGHSTVTNTSRYTGQYPGWHMFSGGVGFVGNATGVRLSWWRLNGSDVAGTISELQTTTGGVGYAMPTRTKLINLNGTTDYVEEIAEHTAGAALNTDNSATSQSNMTVRFASS